MSDEVVALCQCGQPAPDATLCPDCARSLVAALRAIPELAAELDVVLSRQNRRGQLDIGYVMLSSSPGLPFDVRASDVGLKATAVLARWVAAVRTGWPLAGPEPVRTLPAMSRYLRAAAGWLVQDGSAARALDELEQIVRRLRAVVYFEPTPTSYAGRCLEAWHDGTGPTAECPGELYAREGATEVVCPVCSAVHQLDARREWLWSLLRGHLATALELQGAISSIERPISGGTIRSWISRGELVAQGADTAGKPLYPISRALELLYRPRSSSKRKAAA